LAFIGGGALAMPNLQRWTESFSKLAFRKASRFSVGETFDGKLLVHLRLLLAEFPQFCFAAKAARAVDSLYACVGTYEVPQRTPQPPFELEHFLLMVWGTHVGSSGIHCRFMD